MAGDDQLGAQSIPVGEICVCYWLDAGGEAWAGSDWPDMILALSLLSHEMKCLEP